MTTRNKDIRDGARDTLPVIVAVFPFAVVFGTLASEAGFTLFEIMLASGTIYAGASQYVMLELMGHQASAISIVFAVFLVNTRHILYSASIGRRLANFSFWQRAPAFYLLVDPIFAASEKRVADGFELRPAYYFSYGAVLYVSWMVSNLIGALFGRLIEDPAAYGFDLILPVYFISLVMGFKARPNFWIVIAVSVGTSLIVWSTLGSPWNISIGGVAGLLAAALLSRPKESHERDNV